MALAIQVEELDSMMKSERSPSSVCIWRVPHPIRKTKEEAYLPDVVGLGPYHHFSGNLPNLSTHKLEALRRTVERMSATKDHGSLTIAQGVDILLNVVMELKQQIQSCYDQTFDFVADMFVLDACFIIEICMSTYYVKTRFHFHPVFDFIIQAGTLGASIRADIMKLENQIPLVLLKRFMQIQGINDPILVSLFCTCVFEGITRERAIEVLQREDYPPCHFLEWMQLLMAESISGAIEHEEKKEVKTMWRRFCHSRFLFYKVKAKADYRWSVPRVEDLDNVGILMHPGDKLSFTEKYFNLKAILNLPPLDLDRYSVITLRNVMAFEEHFICRKTVSSFMAFLNCLIEKESDVAILRRAGIIQYLLASDQEVTNLFNGFSDVITPSCIPEIDDNIAEKLRKYHESSARVLVQEFMKYHCSKPWLFCATVAAIIILVCTIVQTIYSVKEERK